MSESIIYRGNNGVEFSKELRADRVFYVGNNGIEYEYFKGQNPILIGDDGIEWDYDRENSFLIANNAVVAKIDKDEQGFFAAILSDGTEYNSNEKAFIEKSVQNVLTLLNSTGDDIIDYTIYGNFLQETKEEQSAKFTKTTDSSYTAAYTSSTLHDTLVFGAPSENLVNPATLEPLECHLWAPYILGKAWKISNLIFADKGYQVSMNVWVPEQPNIMPEPSETLPKTENGITFKKTENGISVSGKTISEDAMLTIYDSTDTLPSGVSADNTYTLSVAGLVHPTTVFSVGYYDAEGKYVSVESFLEDGSIEITPLSEWKGMKIVLEVFGTISETGEEANIELTLKQTAYRIRFDVGLVNPATNKTYSAYGGDTGNRYNQIYKKIPVGKTYKIAYFIPTKPFALNYFSIRSTTADINIDLSSLCIKDALNTDAWTYSAYNEGSGDRNMLPYPYKDTTKTVSGITYTDNGDGTITANGTGEGSGAYFWIRNHLNGFTLPKGIYTLSGGTANIAMYIGLYKNEVRLWQRNTKPGQSLTVDLTKEDYDGVNIFTFVGKDEVIDNETLHPMLELGSNESAEYLEYGKTKLTLKYAPGTSESAVQTQEYLLDSPLSGTQAIDPFTDTLYTYKYKDVIFDGSEEWTRQKENTFQVKCDIFRENIPNRDCIKSSNFKKSGSLGAIGTVTPYGEGYLRFHFDETKLSEPTAEEFCKYLSQHPECVRVLESVETTKISEQNN